MQSNSELSADREPPSPRSGRRRWSRLLRNLTLLAAVYLVFTQTLPRKPGIEAVSDEAWTRELAARRGSVVVVPVWASWCRTCIETFPALVGLSERYSEQGVLFVSLCLDDYTRKDDIETARKIVAATDARFPHFLPKRDIAVSLDALAIDDLPAVMVYDRTGKLRYKLEGDRWSNEISPADVEDAIEAVLSGPGVEDSGIKD